MEVYHASYRKQAFVQIIFLTCQLMLAAIWDKKKPRLGCHRGRGKSSKRGKPHAELSNAFSACPAERARPKMNVLPIEKQVQIMNALVEGCSVRATARLVGGVRHHQAELLADPDPASGECDYTGKPFASLANHSQLR